MVRPRFTTTSGDIEAVGAGNRPGRTGLNSLSTKEGGTGGLQWLYTKSHGIMALQVREYSEP